MSKVNKPTTNNSNTTNTQLNHKLRDKYKGDKQDELDGLFFDNMLKSEQKNDKFSIMQEMHNSQNNNMFLKQEQEKKEEHKISSITQEHTKSVENIQQANASHTLQFCQALQDNHEKHNFEVNLPKVGRFSIGTERAGNKMHFSVSSKEKLACDWLKTHQSEIEKNVGQDLDMNVTLGIEHNV